MYTEKREVLEVIRAVPAAAKPVAGAGTAGVITVGATDANNVDPSWSNYQLLITGCTERKCLPVAGNGGDNVTSIKH